MRPGRLSIDASLGDRVQRAGGDERLHGFMGVGGVCVCVEGVCLSWYASWILNLSTMNLSQVKMLCNGTF